MRLYSDKITGSDMREAFAQARLAGADIHLDLARAFRARQVTTRSWDAERGLQSRTQQFSRGIEFYASSLNGSRPTAHRAIGSYPLDEVPRAASWDDYGQVIARLFLIDHDAVIGNYAGVEDFVRQVEQARRREPKGFLDLVSRVCDECEARMARGGVNAAHEKFCSLHPSNVVAPTLWTVVDEATGKRLGQFTSEPAAAEYIGRQPGAESGRYGIDAP